MIDEHLRTSWKKAMDSKKPEECRKVAWDLLEAAGKKLDEIDVGAFDSSLVGDLEKVIDMVVDVEVAGGISRTAPRQG